MKVRNHSRVFTLNAIASSLAMALVGAQVAHAVDLSDVPLASSSTATIRPNILFVLDDSGSMDWLSMPDEMEQEEDRVAYRTSVCNTIYYNPKIRYVPPPAKANGDRFPDQSFTAAMEDGYSTSSSPTKVDLSSKFRYNSYDNSQAAYYYVLTSGTVSGPLSSACTSSPSFSNSATHTASANGASWKKVQVSSTSGPGNTDERTNFANWYSYYRGRLQMMKAASGRAFVTLKDNYRVGFLTINPGSPVSSSRYLRVQNFDDTHRQAFLDKLYKTTTNGSTPLREALSRAGWIYAGKLDTGLTRGIPTADDPVQYACQQNFTILTTDGYWNGNAGQDLKGNSLGNQDGDMAEVATGTDPDRTPKSISFQVSPRPIWDGQYTHVRTIKTTTREYFLTQSGCSSNRWQRRYNETISTVTEKVSNGIVGTSSTPKVTTNNNQSDISCRSPAPSLPNPNPQVTVSDDTDKSSGGGNSGTLADVAQYYYKTDLRPDSVVWPDKVPASGTGLEDDKATWQHMTTFTLGLGLFGTLKFTPDYKTSTDQTTDFAKIRAGEKLWPDPDDGTNEKADDLWHTAVNGRGQAFNASNPDEIISGLNDALTGVNARVASAAAAATSNLEPVAGDNFAYTASYETVKWQGQLEAREIDLKTGFVSATPIWSAAEKLDAQVSLACDNRIIHLFRDSAANKLVPFKWKTDSCDAFGKPTGAPLTTLDTTEQAFFDSSYADNLSQWVTMTDGSAGTANQKAVAFGPNLVNFIRGQRGNERFVPNDVERLYREREHILGDIVNAQPLFVRRPFAEYADSGYKKYKEDQDGRTPMVYVAANDGMLHALYAGKDKTDSQGGREAWAFIPSMVLDKLHLLADSNWAARHQYTVDGTPIAGDVFDPVNKSWRTILVAGLNKGGHGYYALDVTDPLNPVGLWEFKRGACFDPKGGDQYTDCNLGYSFGNPVISKLKDGRWVVFVTSGYENVSGEKDDGKGFLYVLEAMTGKILRKIGTGVGDATAPSGLGKINNYVLNGLSDNTTERVYGADLLGNVWRFDVNSDPGSVQLIATAKDSSGNPQSITTKPELANIGSPPQPFVYVATGRYLGAPDIKNKQVQSIYAIRDPMSTGTPTAPLNSDLRGSLGQIVITNDVKDGQVIRNGTCTVADGCPSKDGWFADWPDAGERVNVDVKLQLGTLTVLTNVPQNTECNIGGYSYINFFNYASGLPIPGDGGLLGSKLADSLAVGLNIVRLPDGRTVAISTTSDSSQRTSEVPVNSPSINGRRVSWREIGE